MMRGLLGGGGGGGASSGSGSGGLLHKGSHDKAPEGAAANETEELDEKEGSVLMGIISQLRPGMELSRITFPTFVLEPRSMLERITDFLSHPDLIFGAGQVEEPDERFIRVLRYYLAGWHIKPRGVKKPYNPVLGEIFRCRYKYKDGSQGFYIAEQVSHHPPISAFYYVSPENKIEIFGELKPKSRFLGNSVVNEMGGYNHIVLLDRPEDGEYDISMPNMYARGILFGKMVLELGDVAQVTNHKLETSCEVDFKTKGFFSGTYNSIQGKVRSHKDEIGEISGKWSDQMYFQRHKGQKELFFDADKAVAVPKEVVPESEQDENESRRLWSKVTDAIRKGDQDAATDSKSAIEDRQRELARLREDAGEEFVPHYFSKKGGEHRAKFSLPEGKSPQEQIEAVEMWIFGTTTPHTQEDKAAAAEPPKLPSKNAPATAATGSAPRQQAQATGAGGGAEGQPPATPAKTASSGGAAGAAPSASIAMAAPQHSHISSEASSPESGHGHSFFKLGSARKKHTGSVSSSYFGGLGSSKSPPPQQSNPPDHEASSRHVPSSSSS